MRYTPAGLPALDLVLAHRSEVAQEGPPRKVSLEVRALAVGAVSAAVGAMALGAAALFAGFLANTRNGRGLLFHITEVEPEARPPEQAF
jgi:primosomal replication protein N